MFYIEGREGAYESPRHRRLVELTVAEQCVNLYKTGIVQKSRVNYWRPAISGLVYGR